MYFNFSSLVAYAQNNPGKTVAVSVAVGVAVGAAAMYFGKRALDKVEIKELPEDVKKDIAAKFKSFEEDRKSGGIAITSGLNDIIRNFKFCRFSPELKALVNNVTQPWGAFHAHYTGSVTLSAEQLVQLEDSLDAAVEALLAYKAPKKPFFGGKKEDKKADQKKAA